MASIPNTIRKAGIFYFRRAIPKSLRIALGRCELVRSLQTHNQVLARSRSRRLYLESEALFELAGETTVFDDVTIRSLVREFYAFEIDRADRPSLTREIVRDRAVPAARATLARIRGDILQEALATGDYSFAKECVSALLERARVDQDLDPLTDGKLHRDTLRAQRELCRAQEQSALGIFYHEPVDPLFRDLPSGLATSAEQTTIKPASVPTFPDAAAKPTSSEATESPSQETVSLVGEPFTQAAEAFRQMRLRRGYCDKQTALQDRKTYQLFAEICEDRPLRGYVREDAVRFKNVISDLPANYAKAPKYRGMKVVDIKALAATEPSDLLSPRTVQRHLSSLSVLWEDAIEQGTVSTNIFKRFKLPTAKRAQDQRAMWSSSQLTALFNTPIWRGCKSLERRNVQGNLVFRDERFWLPLIAIFSGMRLEEICQLDLIDLRQEEGLWVFDVNDRPPHSLKNQHSIRLVPVHDELIRLGLIVYAQQLREAGKERLFESMERGGADGRYGHNFTKQFSRYRQIVGLYQPGLDFHSFRHSATTFLAQAGVPSEIIDALTGHVTPGETARYTKHYLIGQLQEAVNKLDPKINLRFLHPSSGLLA